MVEEEVDDAAGVSDFGEVSDFALSEFAPSAFFSADALPVDFALSWDDLVIDEGSGYLTEQ